MKKKTDEEFNLIVLTDVRIKISEAFIRLEAELRNNRLSDPLMEQDVLKNIVDVKASQMKREINFFIDSQVDRIKSTLKCLTE
ncbi:MAG: hypothetical protein IJN64_10970 [Lachnospiraceae bacterium]|nr:hypothetical protein [Lachnospiraceae bacterium]